MLSTMINDTVRDANRLLNSTRTPRVPAPGRAHPAMRSPGINLWRERERFVAELELPGHRMEDLEVLVSEDTLTVRGRRRASHPEGAAVLRAERGMGAFERSIHMPTPLDANQAEATLENGVLRVMLPIAASARPKRISIRSGDEHASARPEPEAGGACQPEGEGSCRG